MGLFSSSSQTYTLPKIPKQNLFDIFLTSVLLPVSADNYQNLKVRNNRLWVDVCGTGERLTRCSNFPKRIKIPFRIVIDRDWRTTDIHIRIIILSVLFNVSKIIQLNYWMRQMAPSEISLMPQIIPKLNPICSFISRSK